MSGEVRGVQPAKSIDASFQEKIGVFLDSETQLGVDDQLDVMSDFWNRLGMAMPELSARKLTSIGKTAVQYPGLRMVPAPLLGLEGRIATVDEALKLPGVSFDGEARHALKVPSGVMSEWRELLEDPDLDMHEAQGVYGLRWKPGKGYVRTKLEDVPGKVITLGLRYKLPNGKIAGRHDYVEALKNAGQAVVAPLPRGERVWTYPFIDLAQNEEANPDETAVASYQDVDPILSPEALIATQLLHRVNGSDYSPNIDVANEAVYRGDDEGERPRDVAGVQYVPTMRQIQLWYWNADPYGGASPRAFNVRDAVSGL